MAQVRYLAPWNREDVIEAVEGCTAGEEGVVEALRALRGKPAIYHCISRVVDRRFVFGKREKEKFVGLMRAYERFCQVRVLAFCVMSNHFHILLEVPSPPEERGRDWSDERLLEHLSHLYSKPRLGEIQWWLGHFRGQKNHAAAEQLRDSFFRRMWDLSQFMKSLKQCFTRWFNKAHERRGTLWEERFKSVLVEDGHAAQVVAAYIDLNPVRAGMVGDPREYRWCSYGEAMSGKQRAREGLQRVMFDPASRGYAGTGSSTGWNNEDPSAQGYAGAGKAVGMLTSWRATVKAYREVLYAYLGRDCTAEGQETTPMAVAKALGKRVRAFIDGLVCGTGPFVEASFQLTRGLFGPKRRDGARKLRGLSTELRVMRDLRVEGG